MGGRATNWMTTKEIAERWDCTADTVRRRLRTTSVEMTKFGHSAYLRPDQLAQAERELGIEGMFPLEDARS
jgi:DNA-binding Lrp family transcriptional regulator